MKNVIKHRYLFNEIIDLAILESILESGGKTMQQSIFTWNRLSPSAAMIAPVARTPTTDTVCDSLLLCNSLIRLYMIQRSVP